MASLLSMCTHRQPLCVSHTSNDLHLNRKTVGLRRCVHPHLCVCAFVYYRLCVCFCVCVHAPTVRSKERKALCFLYTPSFFICLKIDYKGEQTQRWLNKNTCAPLHTCTRMQIYTPSAGVSRFIQSRISRVAAAVFKSTVRWKYINHFVTISLSLHGKV